MVKEFAFILSRKIIINDVLCCLRYGESFPVSAEVLDSSFTAPIGKAKVILLLLLIYFRRWFLFWYSSYVFNFIPFLFDRLREKGRM